ncbi:UDP-glucose dehydrogenase family protein [Arthrobacter sp. KK5.5]|uniref:UDP-glucose dehydrogenase family protein n=1 Tax=Arthrobacter sp. KK5.5 TaxID=3373084 RepID=UPI003EE70AC7
MSPKISVIGTGYLGATHAACMAELGFDVVGLDVDPVKIARLSEGKLPFHEPGLPELLVKHVASGKLRFTTSYEEVGAWADVHFIGVGTPQRSEDGGADLRYVDAAVTSLARHITRDALVVGKSTVPVGTARRLKDLLTENAQPGVDLELAWNPEFLREGFAVKDTLTPDRLVIGVESERAEATLREVYASAMGRDTPLVVTDFETAELVKVAANAFLATKISFINAFSEITETVGGDIRTLADAIGYDERIGRKFLNAGVGFGGGCLPKDIRALQARTSELGLHRTMGFLDDIDDINLRRRGRVVTLAHQILDNSVANKRIAVLGVAFKPDSDDVRDSPALDIAGQLYNQGADVVVYDPEANANAKRRFPRLLYVGSTQAATEGAELVLLLTEWKEFRALQPDDLAGVAGRRIIDGRNVLPHDEWEDAGWTVAALGRKFR